MTGTKITYDEDAGTFDVNIFVGGVWRVISNCCVESEAEEIIEDIEAWKQEAVVEE